DTEIVGATGRFGARLMRSPAETAIGTHAALDAIADNVAGCDAIIIAAFGDYGVTAARALFEVPVVGIADAAFAALRLAGTRFAILTVAHPVVAALTRAVADAGLTNQLTGVHVPTVQPGDAKYGAGAAQTLRALVERDRPDAVLAVGPPLAEVMPALREAGAVPILEGVACAVVLAEAMVKLGLRGSAPGASGSASNYAGLSPALSTALARRG
ncbi:MAG: aspartate/glutamate racemase family protein, partial [Alphaproteobacteria bacterium]